MEFLGREQLEVWFAPLAETIQEFASRHNLLLLKYEHSSPSWTLKFNHPKGGQVSLSISRLSSTEAEIQSHWYLDDYEKFTRFIYSSPPSNVTRDSKTLRGEFERQFAEILAMDLGRWNRIVGGYESAWSQLSKRDFEAAHAAFPDPIA
jgi:hypothetical protein